ncbi:MAG: MFS transporter [Gemmataceae bacterium]|nr:MFS transporter [Gemmataceae bacterium]MDW8266051.1 MFS transporter [Gemmataceae bacterium]
MFAMLLWAADAPPLDWGVRIPLSLMFFLEFAIWGAWYVVLGQYLTTLGFSGKQIGSIYSTLALGSIVAPPIFGALADQYVEAQYLVGGLHLVGAAFLLMMASIRTPGWFFLAALGYALVYAPTLPLTNAIVFAKVPDATRDFPTIRVLGTIGWIAANLFLKVLLKPGEPVNNRPLLLAVVLSVVLGLYSFALPSVPPGLQGTALKEKLTTLMNDFSWPALGAFLAKLFPFTEALNLFRDFPFAVFFSISLLVSIAMSFYFSFTSIYLEQGVKIRPDYVGPITTLGQAIEIIFMFTLGYFISTFGMKAILVAGMSAWALRYLCFALSRPFVLVLLGLALHGVCFDFFFGAGFIHVETTAPEVIRSSAQALYSTLVYGIGMYTGTVLSGWVNQGFTREFVDPVTQERTRITDWRSFWLVPFVGVVACLVPFVIFFR